MHRYLARRLVEIIPSLFLLTLGVFALIHLIPGDPIATMLGENARPGSVEELRDRLGLNDPLPLQYMYWMRNLVQGDMGSSIITGAPVSETIASRLTVTLGLTLLASAISILIAIPAGILAALRRNTLIDQSILLGSLLGVTVPGFFIGIMLILLFSVELGWFPAIGYTSLSEDPIASLHSLLLPAVALGGLNAAILTRMTRTSLLDVLNQDYVRTARAKGLAETTVVLRHALRNAIVPIITVIGLNFGQLLGGSVIIEVVFSLPGVGTLVVTAIYNRDYPVIQGVILVIGVALLFITLAVDLLYAAFDPRIRFE